MSNIILPAATAERPAGQVIQKPILTTTEAAEMLGISRQKLRSLDIPRHVLSSRFHFYLTQELVEWVRQLPQYGEMPHDRAAMYSTGVMVV